MLLSTTTMELSGSIDVSSQLTGGAQLRGAGASPMDPALCAFATAPTAPTMGGGGAGGSFGTQGGDGGDQGVSPAGGGKAGSKLDMFPPVLHGGCKGSDGSELSASSAAGGDGGGAVALIAGMQIQVDAMINASGGGGQGGAVGAINGGGGGAGGMIVFDSPQPLMLGTNAKLWANGGSGGQGGSTTAGGGAGSESIGPGSSAMSMMTGLAGGIGADGAIGSNLGARGGNSTTDGGGGGGGGVGVIHAPGLTAPTSISPPSSG